MKISTFCSNIADDKFISGLILKLEGLKIHCHKIDVYLFTRMKYNSVIYCDTRYAWMPPSWILPVNYGTALYLRFLCIAFRCLLYCVLKWQQIIFTSSITFIFHYRCRLPDVQDDSFSTLTTGLETSNVSIYNASQCYLTTNETAIPCNKWIYDSSVYTSTLISKVSIIFF